MKAHRKKHLMKKVTLYTWGEIAIAVALGVASAAMVYLFRG